MHPNKPIARTTMARRGLVTLAGVLACAATSLAAGPAALAAASGAPLAASDSPQLNGVSADSSTDAWTVGSYGTFGLAPLVQHWDGTTWTKVKAPNPGGAEGATSLSAVSADSATDAWAVGRYSNPNSGIQANSLVLHWNGTAWVKVASPSPGGNSGLTLLNGVTALSPTDVWAVGWYSTTSGQSQPLVLHWNGTSLQQVTVPAPGGAAGENVLVGVSAVSASDVWATGYSSTTSGGGTGQSLALHWNGTTWKQVASPSPGGATGLSFLVSVHAITAANAWAVGYSSVPGAGQQSLILHWTGKTWKQVTSPSPGGATGDTDLTSVTATSASNIWVAGDYQASGKYGRSLILHSTGSTWKQVASPSPGGSTHSTFLTATSADAPGDAWATGYHFTNGGETAPVLLHWNGTTWSKTPNPS